MIDMVALVLATNLGQAISKAVYRALINKWY